MKRKLLYIILVFLVLLTGCKTEKVHSTKSTSASEKVTDTSAYAVAMKKGKEAIANQKFDKAEAAFELALEYDSESEAAKNYLKRIALYKEALENFDAKNYIQALVLVNSLKVISDSQDFERYTDELVKQVNQALDQENKANVEPIAPPQITVRKYTPMEQQAIALEFLNWAIPRAEMGNMCVSSQYFGHGSGGTGDWYALTVDGRMMTQVESQPGYDAFELHSLGGVVFYTSLDGSVGLNESFESIASGYSTKANPEKKITKYILADTGTIYEYGAVGKEMLAFSSGFTEALSNGAFSNEAHLPIFQQSQDVDAINKLQEILKKYQ